MTRLRVERLKRGWSLQKMGSVAEVQGSEISKFERLILKPYPVQLERLARVLGIPGEELLEEVPGSEVQEREEVSYEREDVTV